MEQTTRLRLTELNQHLVCVLCGGYLVDATTIVECLHSFCRSCIVRHLEANKSCPRCDDVIHKTKPLINLRPDRALQTLVYKLVPGLYQNEMNRRRKYYSETPSAVPVSDEDGGAVADSHLIYTEDEKISLCLHHCDRLPSLSHVKTGSAGALAQDPTASKDSDRRHLLCPALLTIGHLKKFIRHKFDLAAIYQIEVFHTRVSLKDACTLMDVANIYSWKRVEPLRLYYLVFDKTQLSLDLPEPSDKPIITTTVRLPKKPAGPRRKHASKANKHLPDKAAKVNKSAPKSPKNSKKGLVKSKRFQPPPPGGDNAAEPGKPSGEGSESANKDIKVEGDTEARGSPDCLDENIPLAELQSKLKTSLKAKKDATPCDQTHELAPDVIVIDGDVSDNKASTKNQGNSGKCPSGISNGLTNNLSSTKKATTAKDKVKKVQSIKLLASKLVNLNGKLFDTEKKHKRQCPDKVSNDFLASGGNPKPHTKSPLKYTKLSTKSRKTQPKCAKTATKSPKVVTPSESTPDKKVSDEYDFDMECEENNSKMDVKSPVDMPSKTDSPTVGTVTVDDDKSVAMDTSSDCKCSDKPQPVDVVFPVSKDQTNTTTPVPSPTPDPDPSVTEDVVPTDVTQTMDLVNQPDLVRSNLLTSQQKTCRCGGKPPKDSVTDSEKTRAKKGPGEATVVKQRMEVISSPADTSSPQLDVVKPDDDQKTGDRAMDSPQTMEASPTASSPPSPVSKVTVTQSDSTTQQVSPAPSTDSMGRDSQPTTPDKPSNSPNMPRARKVSDTTARDKAKSINSIIKRIEERNHGIQKKMETSQPLPTPLSVPQKPSAPVTKLKPRVEPQKHIPPPSPRPEPQTASRTSNSPHSTVSSPSLAHLVAHSPSSVASLAPGAYSPGLSQVRASSSPTHTQLAQHPGTQRPVRSARHPVPSALLGALQKPLRAQKASKPRGGKRSLPQGHTDTTPIKRLRQMCNGFGNNSILANQLQDRIANPYQANGGYVDPRVQYPPSPQVSKPAADKQSRQAPTSHRTPDARGLRSPQHVQPQVPYQRLHGNSDITDRRPGYTALPTDQFTAVSPSTAHTNGLLSPRPVPHTSAPQNAPRQNLHPAHSNNYKPYYGGYSQPNPRANGYDEPLELTTKPARDRKQAEDTAAPSVGGTFLKIPSLVKP